MSHVLVLVFVSVRFGSFGLVRRSSVCWLSASVIRLWSQRTWNRRFQLLKSQVTSCRSVEPNHQIAIMAMSTLVALMAAVAAGPPRHFGSQPHRGRVAAMSRVSAPPMPPPPSNGSSAKGADAGACSKSTDCSARHCMHE